MNGQNQSPSSSTKITISILIAGLVSTALIIWVIYSPENSKPIDLSHLSPEAAGEILVIRNGCTACHLPDSSFRAPILGASYGRQVTLADGSSVQADDAYMKEAISAPGAKIRQGYQNIMPPYRNALSDQEIQYIVSYIRQLSKNQAQP